jgi:hypothetical protein
MLQMLELSARKRTIISDANDVPGGDNGDALYAVLSSFLEGICSATSSYVARFAQVSTKASPQNHAKAIRSQRPKEMRCRSNTAI